MTEPYAAATNRTHPSSASRYVRSDRPGVQVPNSMTLTGSGFTSRVKVTASGTGVSVKASVTDSSHLALSVSVAGGTPPSTRDVTVTNKDGASVTAPGALSTTQDLPPAARADGRPGPVVGS